ncbi:MAG: hypothetical protein ABIF77_15570 [bacterium]
MTIWLLAIGLISILGQVVLLRELTVAFYGSELITILSLGFWCLWSAVGAGLGRRAYLPSRSQVGWLLAGFGLLLPLCVVLVRALRLLAAGVPGAYLSFPQQIVGLVLSLLPCAVALGLLFQWAAKLYIDRRHSLPRAYAIESLGGLLGGVLASFGLRWGIQNLTAALCCGLLAVAATLMTGGSRQGRPIRFVAVGLALLLGLGLTQAGPLDAWLTGWNHPQLLVSRDTPYGRITLTETAGQIALFENDALVYESEGTAAEEFVHLAAIQHIAPESVLVLGGEVAALTREVLRHAVTAVTCVELNRDRHQLLTRYTDPIPDGNSRDSRVTLVHTDPRRFLQTGSRYDLILVGEMEPGSGASNRFFTREFFQLCAGSLTREGVLAFRLRGAENIWTPQLLRRAASIRRAASEVFASVVFLPGVVNIVLASPLPLVTDPAELGERLESRRLQTRLVSPAYLEYLYTNDRYLEIPRLLDATPAPVNSDVRPICYQYTLLLWLARFFPVLTLLDVPELRLADLARSPLSWLVLVAGVAGLWLCRRRRGSRRIGLVALAGLLGMMLEAALLLNFQVREGVLYQDLGLLLTMFMAGLALGASVVDRFQLVSRRAGIGFWCGFIALALLVAWPLQHGYLGGLLATGLLLLGSGFLVAAVFARASLAAGTAQRLVVSPLYAADLVGGCFGSVLASLLFIPVLGLAGTAVLVAVLALAALSLV